MVGGKLFDLLVRARLLERELIAGERLYDQAAACVLLGQRRKIVVVCGREASL